MYDLSPIQQQLTRWDRRRKIRDLLIWAPRGLMAGLFIAVAIAALARFRPLLTNLEIGYVAAGLGVIGLIIGSGFVWLQRRSPDEQAHFADQTFDLKERLTAALELNAGTIEAPETLQAQQYDDTLSAIGSVDTETTLPYELNGQDWTLILLALVLLIGAILLPNRMESILQGQREVEQLVEDQIERIEQLEEEIANNDSLTEAEKEELSEPLESARQALEDGVDSKEEALAALSQAESALRQLEEQNSTEALEAQMAQAGNSLSSQSGQSLGEALQAGDLPRTATELDQLSESVGDLSEVEQQELGRELSQAASALEAAGSDSELANQLAEAGSALQQGDVAAAEAALAEAGQTAEALGEAGQVAEAAGEAAGELSQGRQEVTESGSETGAGENGEPSGEQAANRVKRPSRERAVRPAKGAKPARRPVPSRVKMGVERRPAAVAASSRVGYRAAPRVVAIPMRSLSHRYVT